MIRQVSLLVGLLSASVGAEIHTLDVPVSVEVVTTPTYRIVNRGTTDFLSGTLGYDWRQSPLHIYTSDMMFQVMKITNGVLDGSVSDFTLVNDDMTYRINDQEAVSIDSANPAYQLYVSGGLLGLSEQRTEMPGEEVVRLSMTSNASYSGPPAWQEGEGLTLSITLLITDVRM